MCSVLLFFSLMVHGGKAHQAQKENQQVQVQTQKKAKLKDIFSSDFVGTQKAIKGTSLLPM